MGAVEFIALELAGVGPVLALARLLRLPATVVLFGTGLAGGLLPGPAPVRVDPDLAIALFLPPVIYTATVRTSPHLLRHPLLPGVAIGAAVSLVTVLGVAAAIQWVLLRGLGRPAAIILGVVAALFETRLFQEADGSPLVPRGVSDALKACEMASRIVALTALSLAIGTLRRGETPGLADALLRST